MKKLLAICSVMVLVFAFNGLAVAQPTIDGVISPGEWDAYFLGTSTTSWGGGTSVDVYGFTDGTYLYAAYVADTSQPGWASACGLNVNANLYFKTPQSASWPDQGYTILEMVFPRVQQTDGSDWVDIGTLAANGVEFAYIDMFDVDDNACAAGTTDNNIAEFKIPLSLITYAGYDNLVLFNGQYWQYDFATSFYVVGPPSYTSVGDCISFKIGEECTGLTGKDRSDCVKAQIGFCHELFGVPSAHTE